MPFWIPGEFSKRAPFFYWSFQKVINFVLQSSRSIRERNALRCSGFFVFYERLTLPNLRGVKSHVLQTKRALVKRWLDRSGGTAPNTVSMPIRRNKMKRRSAQKLKPVKVALSRPAVSFAGVKTEIVWEPESINYRRIKRMIQLKINHMDHKAVLTVPTDY